MSQAIYFSDASFRFLRALARHNDRTWFLGHRDDYARHVQQPMLRLIADLAEPMHHLAPDFVVDPRPVGGSMFRIHRDTRFSHDKRPYKEWASARFLHRSRHERDGDVPCFYLHVEPDASFLGAGIWHPSSTALKRIRSYLVNNPTSWMSATRGPDFSGVYQLGGNRLTRPPQGYDPAHPLIDDLKRKDFIADRAVRNDFFTQSDLIRRTVAYYTPLIPLVDWLCGALDLSFDDSPQQTFPDSAH